MIITVFKGRGLALPILLIGLMLVMGSGAAWGQTPHKSAADRETMDANPRVPALTDLIDVLLAQNALNLKDSAILDDLVLIRECPLWTESRADEFRWQELRAALRQSLAANRIRPPETLYWMFPATLGEYDFSNGRFPLYGNAVPKDLDQLTLDGQREATCDNQQPRVVPTLFWLRFSDKLTRDFIDLTPPHAKAFLRNLDSVQEEVRTQLRQDKALARRRNPFSAPTIPAGRQIYVQLALSVGRAELVADPTATAANKNERTRATQAQPRRIATIAVDVTGVRVFADPQATIELLEVY